MKPLRRKVCPEQLIIQQMSVNVMNVMSAVGLVQQSQISDRRTAAASFRHNMITCLQIHGKQSGSERSFSETILKNENVQLQKLEKLFLQQFYKVSST